MAEPGSEKRLRASRDGLVRQLSNAGFRICTFTVSSTGQYSTEDADWNYKDVPHLNVVHSKVRTIIGSMDDDVITTLNLQKVFGIPFPVALVNYVTSPTSQTYFTTLGPYVLVVCTSYAAIGEDTTCVTTEYNIAAKGPARFLFPVLKRVIEGNYKTLMSEDLPMRVRRGQLRAGGFRFKSDGRARTFSETTDLRFENVLPPERAATRTEQVSLDALASEGASILVGPDDDRGVRVLRRGDELLVLPRYCSHEGASLTCAEARNGTLVCPWHAKRIPPILSLAYHDGASSSVGATRAEIEAGRLTLTLPSEITTAPAISYVR